MSSTSSPIVDPSSILFTQDGLLSYRYKLYFNFGLTLISNIYGIFMVFRHSPKEMATYRWFLLNIIIWAFLMDFCLTLLFQPYLLLPIFGFCTLGIIAGLSRNSLITVYALMFIFLEIAVSCCASIYIALLYRLSAIFNSNSFYSRAFRSWWGIAIMATCCTFIYFYVGFLVVEIVVALDQNLSSVRQQYYSNFPGIRTIVDSNLCIFSTIDDPNIRLAIIQALFFLSFCIIFAIAIVTIAIATLFSRKNWLSPNTFRIHKQFIMALLLQIAVPFGSIIIPITIMAFCIYFNLAYPRSVDDYLLVLCSSHSSLNVLVMVLCTRPYWEATKGYLLMPLRLLFPSLPMAKQTKTVKNQTAMPKLTIITRIQPTTRKELERKPTPE